MVGLLDGMSNWFADPNNRRALGILSANLMAAGAPSYDPGASQRYLAQGLQGYGDALAEGRERQLREEFRKAQLAELESETKERERKAEAALVAQRMLLGPYLTGSGPAEQSFRAAQDEGATGRGILAGFEGQQGDLLRGLTAIDPEKGLTTALTLSSREAKPPQSRTRTEGDVTIFEEYNPKTMRFEEVSRGPRYKPETNVTIKQPGEIQGTLDAIAKARAEGNHRLADKLEMSLTFGNKPPPEAYIKARQNIDNARTGISKAYELIASGTGPILPADRAKLAQAFNEAKLAYADLSNRGANFTEQEEKMVDSVLGGDPNKIAERVLRGDQSYLEGLRNAAEIIERRGAGLMDAYTKPGIGEAKYPWQKKGGSAISEERRRELEKKYGVAR